MSKSYLNKQSYWWSIMRLVTAHLRRCGNHRDKVRKFLKMWTILLTREGKETSTIIIQEWGINKTMDGRTLSTQICFKIKIWVLLFQVLFLVLINSKYHHHMRTKSQVLRRCSKFTWQVMIKSSNSNRLCCNAMDQPFSNILLCCKIKEHRLEIWRYIWGRLLVH